MNDLDDLIEITIEGFDNAVMNLPEAEKWLNDGGTITMVFKKDGTDVKTKGGK